MILQFSWLSPSPERIRTMITEIAESSQPRIGFYALLVLASLIASIGLIANSTAVVIGVMLVSPLMTPIFGSSLGMLRGNANLFSRALLAEVVGVFLAVGVAFLFREMFPKGKPIMPTN
jgi:uncharacterized membrane protein